MQDMARKGCGLSHIVAEIRHDNMAQIPPKPL